MTSHRLTPYLFILPALAVYGLFVVFPILDSFHMSFLHWESPLLPPEFCGLENFRRLLVDEVFWRAMGHNFLLLAGSLLLQLPLAALLAFLLYYPTLGRTVFRTAFFAPMVMPTAAIAVLWQYVYEPGNGLLTSLLRLAVDQDFSHAWLADPGTALLWIFVTICWQYTGFHMVLFMAGLSAIPADYFEAARLDGAKEWQVCWHVALPALRPTIAVSATLSIVGSLKYFDLVYLMAGGLPETSREVLATYIYRLAFDQNQGRYGYGSAVAVMLFLAALAIITPLQARRLRAAGTADRVAGAGGTA
ncbi:MAG: sugar ABC transporter permease [Lentisphaeria bacterium]|jgi:raffinose/stachyose/melibiose transport system permease protein|nr:sugar ABC transporter permease [Lentisphaeria bacterium]